MLLKQHNYTRCFKTKDILDACGAWLNISLENSDGHGVPWKREANLAVN